MPDADIGQFPSFKFSIFKAIEKENWFGAWYTLITVVIIILQHLNFNFDTIFCICNHQNMRKLPNNLNFCKQRLALKISCLNNEKNSLTEIYGL